jgi:hypothetical protein
MSAATTPAPLGDTALAALRDVTERAAADERRAKADRDWARLEEQGPFIHAARPSTILALFARLDAAERTAQHYRNACAEADDRAQAAEARAERLAAVLEAEREERRAERAVREAEYAISWAEARDDDAAYERAMQQHTAAIQAYCLAHQRAETARAALAAGRGEA